jgi:hypothetical protein
MSHFYSRIQGHKGQVTRCGTKTSGIRAEATGWDIGTISTIRYDPTIDTDVVSIYITGGSNNNANTLLAEMYKAADGSYKCLRTNYPELLV